MPGRQKNYFKWFTTGVLVVFSVTILLILIADIAYVNGASVLEVLRSENIRSAFILSFTTSLLAAAISVLVAVPAAYALSRFPFRGSMMMDTLVDLLIAMPVLVIGVSLLVFFRMGSDLAESDIFFIRWFGKSIAMCGEFFIYTKAGIVLAQFFCAISYAIRTIKATFDEIDPRTEQVAMTLGCTRAGAFYRVTLPLAKQGIIAGAVLSWIRAFGIFGAIIIVSGAVRGKTEVLPTAIYLEISIGRLEVALVISLVMMFSAGVVLIILRLLSGRSVFSTGGSK